MYARPKEFIISKFEIGCITSLFLCNSWLWSLSVLWNFVKSSVPSYKRDKKIHLFALASLRIFFLLAFIQDQRHENVLHHKDIIRPKKHRLMAWINKVNDMFLYTLVIWKVKNSKLWHFIHNVSSITLLPKPWPALGSIYCNYLRQLFMENLKRGTNLTMKAKNY